MAGVRIAGLEEVMTLNENMVLATDGPDGTKKINANSMMEQYANGSQMINNPLAVVGSAQQLIGDTGTEDTTPYLYRKTPYTGDRSYLRKLVGGSAVWNQLKSGLHKKTITTTPTIPEDNEYYSNYGTAVDDSIIAGHRYFVKMSVQSGSENFLRMSAYVGVGSAILCENNNSIEKVVTAINTLNILRAYASNNQQTSATITLQVFDLTQMFQPEIADYVYQLEQSQVGSGIAYLRSYGFLTNDYYATDSGSIQSVSVSGKKVVGFNQWDEQWEVGSLNIVNGQNADDNTRIRTKGYIRVIPAETYYLKCPVNDGRGLFYDENKNYITYNSDMFVNGIFTVPNNCHFIRFSPVSSYGTIYNNDICINLSKTTGTPKNGDYLPYATTTYTLPHDTLRGIIKKDASNRLYYDGDERYPDKKAQRYEVVDLGTLPWEYDGSIMFADDAFAGDKVAKFVSNSTVFDCISAFAGGVSFSDVYGNKKGFCVSTSGKNLYCAASGYTSYSDFKTAMSGVMLVYPLATPIVTTEPSYQSLQIVDGDGTEEMIDYLVEQGDRDVAIPVGHETTYLPDLRKKLEDLPQIPPAPTTDGTYTLTATVSGGTATYSWE